MWADTDDDQLLNWLVTEQRLLCTALLARKLTLAVLGKGIKAGVSKLRPQGNLLPAGLICAARERPWFLHSVIEFVWSLTFYATAIIKSRNDVQ